MFFPGSSQSRRTPLLFFWMNNSSVRACFFLLTVLTWTTTCIYTGLDLHWIYDCFLSVSLPFQTGFLSSSLPVTLFLKMRQQWWKKWKHFTFVYSFLINILEAMVEIDPFQLRCAGPPVFLACCDLPHSTKFKWIPASTFTENKTLLLPWLYSSFL